MARKKSTPILSDDYPLVAQAVCLLKAVGFTVLFEKMTLLRQERLALCLLGAANLKPGDD